LEFGIDRIVYVDAAKKKEMLGLQQRKAKKSRFGECK